MPDKAACKQIYSHESLVTTQKKSHATESCKTNSETGNKHFTKIIFGNCQQKRKFKCTTVGGDTAEIVPKVHGPP